MSITVPLLESKLRAPRRRRGTVHRPRLASRSPAPDHPLLTLVSAPAGFGKTTLLAEWFGDEPRVCWLSLDSRDSDPTLFWSYLVAAIRPVVAGAGEAALALLGASPPSTEAGLAMLLNDLASVDDDFFVVLDDYHAVESAEVHEGMAYLVDHLPPQVHLVIASRADPPLALARLRARGELREVRASALRFTADEVAAYLNDAMGLALDGAAVDALETRTEGWIAALQLAALSMQGRDDVGEFIAGFTGTDRFVVDYLVEEVLERQPDEVRRFLLDTAVLHRLTGSLCDAVTGGQDGRGRLEALDRANLFLVPLDDRRQWYRYHHLFGDVLRARLQGEAPERVRDLHRRAGAWYEANGFRPDAIEHAMAGEDFEHAAELVERAAPQMRQTRQERTLRRWLEAIPAELFTSRPVLSLALVGARMGMGDPTDVEQVLTGVEQTLAGGAAPIVFDEEEYARLPAQVAVYRAGQALLAGDLEATVAHAGRVLRTAQPSDHLQLGAASALMGLAHWASGELPAARSRYADALQHLVNADFLPDVLGVSLGLADIQMAQGGLLDAIHTFEAGLELVRHHPGLRGTADMHAGISEPLLARNEVDRARSHLDAARELGEHAGLPQHPYRSRVAMALLRRAEGDLDGAIELLEAAEPLYNSDFSPPVRPVAALAARVRLARGDLRGALRWVTDTGVTADDDLAYVREFEHVTLARVLLARDRDRASLTTTVQFLDRLLAAALAGGRQGSAVEILILLALAHDAAGDRSASVAALQQALERAEPDGFVRVFLEEGPQLTALLRSARWDGSAGRHAHEILDAGAALPPAAPTVRNHLVEELSTRERDVLRLLRSDLSGPDIARELTVSLNTLRTHTKRIYTKLGVTNRREAVRRAGELGL